VATPRPSALAHLALKSSSMLAIASLAPNITAPQRLEERVSRSSVSHPKGPCQQRDTWCAREGHN
jgi:hypothetical protein